MDKLTGTTACPICGVDTPHGHSREGIAAYVNNLISAWGYEAFVVPRGVAAETVRDRLIFQGRFQDGGSRTLILAEQITDSDETVRRRDIEFHVPIYIRTDGTRAIVTLDLFAD